MGVTPARAADLDFGTLRGGSYDTPAPVGNWDGFYVGGHGGWTSTSFGFGNVFQAPVANYFRLTTYEANLSASTLLRAQDARRDGTSFGAYAGVNFQFDEFVAGAELDYTHLGVTGSTTDAIARQKVTDGYWQALSLVGEAKTRLDDYATIRARFGYDAGNFMPYVTGGFAIGRAQITDTVTIQARGYDQATYNSNQATGATAYVNRDGYRSFDPTNVSRSVVADPDVVQRTREKIVGGIAAGAGMEFALTANILLRAEYQFVQFNDFDGHKANINTVRGGASVKF
ncbi:outer membrane protein [Methylobacterium nodulans]|uniref:Porin n=1 Tax=Methylobacterium nodulans (strain LMG 21967 / CNCM I-2342 / ORS 2060) TaxID=460265 RepID=B8ID27_METNO|nr:outer membrane beta-barrel protein [Methylobacterium nodulans]ACL59419.1 porin [Methylobacterium nodulans ORS 2060]